MKTTRIVVIGGGFSGVMVAYHLLRQSSGQTLVQLIERSGVFARGLAYGTDEIEHLLNVPAKGMSALADQPSHFFDWATHHSEAGVEVTPDAYLPRRFYARYLTDLLAEGMRNAPSGVMLEKVIDEAVDVEKLDSGFRVQLRGGKVLEADFVVLALGNFPPQSIVRTACGPLANPWKTSELNLQDEPTFLVGSGLTMVDIALSWRARGFQSPLIALSRHGRVPQAHVPGLMPRPWDGSKLLSLKSARKLVRFVRTELKKALAEGANWRSVIDGLRPHTNPIWNTLSIDDKRRFLRHVKSVWDVHRHRIAPAVARQIDEMRERQQLTILAGRITDIHEVRDGVDIVYQPRGEKQKRVLRVSKLINCTGPSLTRPRVLHPLLAALDNRGLLRAHAVCGVDAKESGALEGCESIFVLGSLRIGSLWESIAVPELRGQAETVAKAIGAMRSRREAVDLPTKSSKLERLVL